MIRLNVVGRRTPGRSRSAVGADDRRPRRRPRKRGRREDRLRAARVGEQDRRLAIHAGERRLLEAEHVLGLADHHRRRMTRCRSRDPGARRRRARALKIRCSGRGGTPARDRRSTRRARRASPQPGFGGSRGCAARSVSTSLPLRNRSRSRATRTTFAGLRGIHRERLLDEHRLASLQPRESRCRDETGAASRRRRRPPRGPRRAPRTSRAVGNPVLLTEALGPSRVRDPIATTTPESLRCRSSANWPAITPPPMIPQRSTCAIAGNLVVVAERAQPVAQLLAGVGDRLADVAERVAKALGVVRDRVACLGARRTGSSRVT